MHQCLQEAPHVAAQDGESLHVFSVEVVIPVYNERENVQLLHERLVEVAERLPAPRGEQTLEARQAGMPARWEFIFVDDGSTDGSWESLRELQAADARVRSLRLKRNFGQTPAMACGIDHTRKNGDGVSLMFRRKNGGGGRLARWSRR